MVKFAGSTSEAQGFTSSDPGTWHSSSSHAEAVSHIPQLEGPTTKNTQLCTGGLWGAEEEEKKEDWQQMLAQVPIFKKK